MYQRFFSFFRCVLSKRGFVRPSVLHLIRPSHTSWNPVQARTHLLSELCWTCFFEGGALRRLCFPSLVAFKTIYQNDFPFVLPHWTGAADQPYHVFIRIRCCRPTLPCLYPHQVLLTNLTMSLSTSGAADQPYHVFIHIRCCWPTPPSRLHSTWRMTQNQPTFSPPRRTRPCLEAKHPTPPISWSVDKEWKNYSQV